MLTDSDVTYPDSLVGYYFLGSADRGWQGRVVAQPAPGLFLVQLYEWLMGTPSCCVLTKIEDMTDWRFYASDQDMRDDVDSWRAAKDRERKQGAV